MIFECPIIESIDQLGEETNVSSKNDAGGEHRVETRLLFVVEMERIGAEGEEKLSERPVTFETGVEQRRLLMFIHLIEKFLPKIAVVIGRRLMKNLFENADRAEKGEQMKDIHASIVAQIEPSAMTEKERTHRQLIARTCTHQRRPILSKKTSTNGEESETIRETNASLRSSSFGSMDRKC